MYDDDEPLDLEDAIKTMDEVLVNAKVNRLVIKLWDRLKFRLRNPPRGRVAKLGRSIKQFIDYYD